MALTFPEFILCGDFDVLEGPVLGQFDAVAGTEDEEFEEEGGGGTAGGLERKEYVSFR